MKRILLRVAVLSALVSSNNCSTPKIKVLPEFTGIHSELKPYYDEWMALAKERNIEFKHKVSIGFKKIDSGRAVGMCWYLWRSREIEIDSYYWIWQTETTKRSLMYHELTHCYCGRPHDDAKGKEYPEADELQEIFSTVKRGRGYFKDGCPNSIMYPIILDDLCYFAHYRHYMDEMFNRCKAW